MNEPGILINDFLDKINFKTRKEAVDYYKFIEDKFIPFRSKSAYTNIKMNVQSLETMKLEDVMFVKARLKQLEEDNDPSKYFPAMVPLFVMVLSIYIAMFNVFKTYSIGIISTIVLMIIIIPLSSIFRIMVKRRNTNIYLNSLFNNIEFKQKND